MRGASHLAIVKLAASVMPTEYSGFLSRLQEGIKEGASLTDEFRWYWEMDDGNVGRRIRMHRCYMDSDDHRDHGCPVQIVRYATGIPGLLEGWVDGTLADLYDDDELFFLNAGSYFGIVSHHIADLCTPVHVGHAVHPTVFGYRSRAGLHSRVEADLDRAAASIDSLQPFTPQPNLPTVQTLESVASKIYRDFYLRMASVYRPLQPAPVRAAFFSGCIVAAAKLTAEIWLGILTSTDPQALSTWC